MELVEVYDIYAGKIFQEISLTYVRVHGTMYLYRNNNGGKRANIFNKTAGGNV
jgi:hypothetical protein